MTSAELTNTALKFANSVSIKSALSTTLQGFYNPLLPPEQQIEHLDLGTTAVGTLANSALTGLELFTNLKTLKFEGQTTLEWAANISSLTNLEFLQVQAAANGRANVVGDAGKLTKLKRFQMSGGGKGMYGDMRALTTLNYFFAGANDGTDIQVIGGARTTPTLLIYPVIGLNKSLTSYTGTNYKYGNGWDTAQVGTISDLMALTALNINSGKSTTAVVDNILVQLRTLKTAGGALTPVDLSGSSMGIPTGANNNADRLALVSAGVSVTVRTV